MPKWKSYWYCSRISPALRFPCQQVRELRRRLSSLSRACVVVESSRVLWCNQYRLVVTSALFGMFTAKVWLAIGYLNQRAAMIGWELDTCGLSGIGQDPFLETSRDWYPTMPLQVERARRGWCVRVSWASMVVVFQIYSCDGLLAYNTVCQLWAGMAAVLGTHWSTCRYGPW